ncbi:MAG TPA: nucleotide sugar dehydrogenase, partial [Thermoanaerobaculia bacterium]|nr:nucleotide sugar dehydrogenase [Thermoanaerobaculia bacterium]
QFPDGNDLGTLDTVPVVHTDITSAQMIKYASNAFLATRVSFINEVAGVCERVGASIQEVARGIGYDPRIGPSYLSAGIGFGGPCLEKDLKALIKIAEANDYEPRVLRAVLGRNDRQVDEVMAKLKKLSGYLLYRKIIAVLGLSFKAGTNDARNSMSLKVVDRLRKEGARVQAYDPLAMEESREVQPDVDYCDDPYAAARHADAVLFLTDWPEFRDLDFGRLRATMAGNTAIDARNFLDREALTGLGFAFEGIGVKGG